jgi:ComF family protein
MLRRAAQEALSLLVPPACVACRAPAVAGEPLCARCRGALPWLPARRCERCGLPSPCGPRCPAARSAWDRAWSAVAYDGPARELVLALKFRGALPVAGHMAAAISATAPPGLLAGQALVPVPLPRARERRRGFDQAQRLARALSLRTGAPLAECLSRRGGTARQLGASRAARLAAGRLGVECAPGRAPREAVLVDDVHTTGATFEACARALRTAGSERVCVVSYARTL